MPSTDNLRNPNARPISCGASSAFPAFIILSFALSSVALAVSYLAPKHFSVPASTSRSESITEEQIDQRLQRAAENALGNRDGTIIAMDPHTGRLSALVNPRTAFEQAFPPGSTIKPFTALAAMQSGLMAENTRLFCKETYKSDDSSLNCSHARTGAAFDLAEAIAHSCNYYFARLGERLNQKEFVSTLRAFGFGSRSEAPMAIGVENESAGSLPRARRVNNALGEGEELLVTPVQLITAYAALVNGGHLYVPRAGSAFQFKSRERARASLEEQHRLVLLEGMRGAVRFGTASSAGLDSLSIEVLGKTGTSTEVNGYKTDGWFVGFAADGSAKELSSEGIKLVVLVFLKRSNGAESAALSRAIFEAFADESTRETEDRVQSEISRAITYQPAVRVRLTREAVIRSMPLEEYLLGVVAAEASTEDEFQALKAQAIVSRTFALRNMNRHAEDGYDFCDLTHCQWYVDVSDSFVRPSLRRAVTETADETLADQQAAPIEAYFHAACGGSTANYETLWGSQAPNYLQGVQDHFCADRPNRRWRDVIPASKLLAALQSDGRSDVGSRLDNIIVTRRDKTGRAEFIRLEGERRRVLRGWDFKIIVGRALGWNLLKSSRFEVARSGENFVFRGSGFGHGLGLCQEGAHVMAARGASYRQILSHYFPGTAVQVRSGYSRDSLSLLNSLVPSVPPWFMYYTTETRRTPRLNFPMNSSVSSVSSVPPWFIYFTTETRRTPRLDFPMNFSVSSVPPWLTWKASILPGRDYAKNSASTSQFPKSFSSNSSVPPWLTSPRTRVLSSSRFRVRFPARIAPVEIEPVLRTLEAARTDMERRLSAASLTPATGVTEIIVHETTGDFVAATGQPVWAAGATRGNRIELQPLEVLRRRSVLNTTLLHEYAHTVIDALSRGRAPRWLAEGLAIHFAGEGPMIARYDTKRKLSLEDLERELASARSSQQMRSLYAAAYRAVNQLIASEGEPPTWRRVLEFGKLTK